MSGGLRGGKHWGAGLKGAAAQLLLYTLSHSYDAYEARRLMDITEEGGYGLRQSKHLPSITTEVKLTENVSYIALRIKFLKEEKKILPSGKKSTQLNMRAH